MNVKLQSGKIFTREIVEHPGAVTLIPLLDDKVILIRQFRLPVGKAIYELPAGTISEGEDPYTCAEREIVEETGYKAQTGENIPMLLSSKL
jgi:ADP-ribose pyrophosphatase